MRNAASCISGSFCTHRRGHAMQAVWGLALAVLVCPAVSTGQVLPAKSAESAREVLVQVGLDDAFFARFVDNQELSEAEQQALLKLLARVSMLRRVDLERWAQSTLATTNDKEDGTPTRGELYLLRGVAAKVVRVPLTEDQKALFNLEDVFQVEVRLADGSLAEIFTPAVPHGWTLDQKVSEPMSAIALYLKQQTDPGKEMIFVADRVAWNPETFLGKLGMDEGLFDAVKQRAPILAGERECFYQLLAAVSRTKPHQLDAEANAQLQRLIKNYRGEEARSPTIARQLARAEAGRFDVVPLFNEPDKEVGRLVMFEGDARQAIEIRIDDEEIVERLGISRYYEITFFTEDSQQNPLVGCVLNVPADMPLGEDIFARVRLAGFFFKSWAFPRRLPLDGDANQIGGAREQQLAPLIIGRDLSLVTTVVSWPDRALNGAIVSGILASLLAILWAAWKSSRPAVLSKDSATSIAPDFSHLDG